MLSVAIALEPEAPPAVVRQVTKSCEEAIGEGRCRAEAELSPAAVVTWFALVRDGGNSALVIEFHDRNVTGALIETRELALSDRATAESRWASVGAVIAAFVAARDAAGVSAPPRSLPLPLPPSPPAKPERPLFWNLDLAVVTGPALEHGAFRWGGLGRGYLAFPGAPQVLGLASFRYTERPSSTLGLAFWSAGCGIGARLGGQRGPSVELTGELAFERLVMSATDATTGKRDDASQNRFGGRLSVNLALPLVSHLAFVAGTEATALRPSVAIALGEDLGAGRASAVGYGFSGGLRLFSGD